MPSSFSIKDTGRLRRTNQDYVFTTDIRIGSLPNLYIVADGMGGHNAGDYASRFTVDTVAEFVMNTREKDPARILNAALLEANRGLREAAGKDPSLFGMGTTFVAATISGSQLLAANVGDSRLYVLHAPGKIRQITTDHSIVEEMVQAGRIDRETARTLPEKNIITRAVGAEEELSVDFFRHSLTDGDLILLCSDGLTNMLTDSQIAGIVFSHRNLMDAGERLIYEANMAGGRDNISAVLVNPFDTGRMLL
ncbi:MAG: Stp1/IreP family PP2C-type Ser/Thr phosphatase [Eubacteriales bacterium]|nr:Stp1/IreP family PP2C-type Ser/Thr phosphatase [Eubacteriales bacterium]